MEKLNHLAIIMDGNRRWARQHNVSTRKGHEEGAKTLMDICRTLKEYNIPLVTVYAFSTENNSRSKEETDGLFSMLEKYLDSDVKKLQKEKINVRCIGDFSIFPQKIQSKITRVNEYKQEDCIFTLNIALNYGGRQEIINAMHKINNVIDMDNIAKHLYHTDMPDVDLLIRTGGKQRLSNFLLWQSAYAELYFCKTLWPDFNQKELDLAISFFMEQERNFGA